MIARREMGSGRPRLFEFEQVGRLPAVRDNVAIASRRLEVGDRLMFEGRELVLDSTILEGHRFAVRAIFKGELLLSWGLPFGRATRDIGAGGYICNAGMIEALADRSLDVVLPASPNFKDEIVSFKLDEGTVTPAAQVHRSSRVRTFLGYPRSAGRGVGTRNTIVLLAVTSLAGSYVRQLEARLGGVAGALDNVDGVVAVSHTEGGDRRTPNNLELLLRTLAGLVVHPNVGAVLIVDRGTEVVTGERLRRYMEENDYPLSGVLHRFLTIGRGFEEDLDRGEATVRGWLEAVNATAATPVPILHLKLALQCGGSDAFSGVSGNPLASWVAREIIRHGGTANLAETDELIGAEAYVLQRVRDLPTARAFLEAVERFKERAAWHGATAEGNPSGGNKLRGLYNIVLKSIGAAMKKHSEVRLDAVIDYGERMTEPGYYFMDSPGNDLESIAGQVASGCNLIFFVTGNGSITNFPFVPTVKIVTTSGRYGLLSSDMDVNAGAYLDGVPMDTLGERTFELALEVASGRRSVGERAGHAQVQIWRDWPQSDGRALPMLRVRTPLRGEPLALRGEVSVPEELLRDLNIARTEPRERVGLILPTSLCAGQVARMIADRLNREQIRRGGVARFIALVHTEGCGVTGVRELHFRTLLGYLTHPSVAKALLLEHGCEITHNDFWRSQLAVRGLDPDLYGWASIQLDGGIDAVASKVRAWFAERVAREEVVPEELRGERPVALGLLTSGLPTPETARSLALLTRSVVASGGAVVIPETTELLADRTFLGATMVEPPVAATLAHGQSFGSPGLHIMEAPTTHWVETTTGLGATGVEVILGAVADHSQQTHPLLPLLQVTSDPVMYERSGADLDLLLESNSDEDAVRLLHLVLDTLAGRTVPKLSGRGQDDFQLTRGPLGISM